MLYKAATVASHQALTDELNVGKPIQLTVKNDSMSQAILSGDTIEVKSANIHDINQGDILLIAQDDDLIVHRLRAFRIIDGRIHAITKGDSSGTLDNPVPLDSILGKVTKIIRDNHESLPPFDSSTATTLDDALLLASFPVPDTTRQPDIMSGINMEAFLSAADNEQLAQLIYHSHRHTLSRSEHIAGGFASHLRHSYMTVLARNTIFLQEFAEIASSLAGIRFILLKGAYLAQCVYTSPGLRPFSDIDILIRRSDFTRVHAILASSGYSHFPEVQDPPVIPVESDYLNSLMYTHPARRISLHVHWHLTNSTLPRPTSITMDIGDIWNSAAMTPGGFMELSPEHLIIHLAEHAIRHSFDRLILLRDIAEVVEKFRDRVDWNKLTSESRRFKLSSVVYHCLLLAMRKTAVQVPGEILARLAPPRQGLSERLFVKMFDSGVRDAELGSLVHFSNSRSAFETARLAWRMAFPPRATLAYAYNCSKEQIGTGVYASRLFRGMKKAACAGINILKIKPWRFNDNRK